MDPNLLLGVCSAIGAVGGCVYLVLRIIFDLRGKLKPAAQSAIEIQKKATENADKFAENVKTGDLEGADEALSDALDTLDALSVRQEPPKKPPS